MKKTYISIGSDCSVATALQKFGRRTEAYPLDWLCVYHGVSKLFENDFSGFTDGVVTEFSEYNKTLRVTVVNVRITTFESSRSF